MGEQKGSGTQWGRWAHAPTRRALRVIREHLHTHQNTSKNPNSLGRSAETRTERPERLGNPSGASGMRTHEHSDRIDVKLTVKKA